MDDRTKLFHNRSGKVSFFGHIAAVAASIAAATGMSQDIVADSIVRHFSWTAVLWLAMSLTGNGFRKHSLRNTGRNGDRRKDKLERDPALPKFLHAYKARYGRMTSWSGSARARDRALKTRFAA